MRKRIAIIALCLMLLLIAISLGWLVASYQNEPETDLKGLVYIVYLSCAIYMVPSEVVFGLNLIGIILRKRSIASIFNCLFMLWSALIFLYIIDAYFSTKTFITKIIDDSMFIGLFIGLLVSYFIFVVVYWSLDYVRIHKPHQKEQE